MGLFAGIMALVALVTLWIPETKGVSIAQIEKGVLYGEILGSDADETASSEVEASAVQGYKQGLEERKSVVELA